MSPEAPPSRAVISLAIHALPATQRRNYSLRMPSFAIDPLASNAPAARSGRRHSFLQTLGAVLYRTPPRHGADAATSRRNLPKNSGDILISEHSWRGRDPATGAGNLPQTLGAVLYRAPPRHGLDAATSRCNLPKNSGDTLISGHLWRGRDPATGARNLPQTLGAVLYRTASRQGAHPATPFQNLGDTHTSASSLASPFPPRSGAMFVAVGCAYSRHPRYRTKNQPHPGGGQHCATAAFMLHPSGVRLFFSISKPWVLQTHGYKHCTTPWCGNKHCTTPWCGNTMSAARNLGDTLEPIAKSIKARRACSSGAVSPEAPPSRAAIHSLPATQRRNYNPLASGDTAP